jgi:hypothetical protein
MVDQATTGKTLKTSKRLSRAIIQDGFPIPNNVRSNWDLSLGRIPTDCIGPFILINSFGARRRVIIVWLIEIICIVIFHNIIQVIVFSVLILTLNKFLKILLLILKNPSFIEPEPLYVVPNQEVNEFH